MKKDAYYFPHFSNARNDSKILKLRRVMGIEGYGIYFLLLEVLRDQTDFKISVESLEDFAYEWHTSKEKLESVVANFGLFQVDQQNFFSPKFNEYMNPYIEGKESKRIAGIKGNLVRYKHITKEEASNLTDEQILHIDEMRKQNKSNTLAMREVSESVSESVSTPCASQKKGKERKGKEKKVNEIKVNKEEAYAEYSFLFINESFKETYLEFLEVRKEMKKIPTLRAEKILLKKLATFSENGKNIEIAIESLENSIVAKYPNVYQPKVNFKSQGSSENLKSNFEKNNEVYQNTQKILDSEEYQKASALRKVWVDPLA